MFDPLPRTSTDEVELKKTAILMQTRKHHSVSEKCHLILLFYILFSYFNMRSLFAMIIKLFDSINQSTRRVLVCSFLVMFLFSFTPQLTKTCKLYHRSSEELCLCACLSFLVLICFKIRYKKMVSKLNNDLISFENYFNEIREN